MNTLVYLCIDGGHYPDELRHAVLSARHALGDARDDCRIVVHTDDPASCSGLPVHVERVDSATLSEWASPVFHSFRRKVCAIRETMRAFGGTLLYCDTDTYCLGDPRTLFARVRPGHTVMHVREGTPRSARADDLSRVLETHELRTLGGQRWNVSPDTPIFNAGVVGLHEADAALLDEVIHLIDQLCPRLPDYFGTEQFSFSACLSERTQVSVADDVVHHYWLPTARATFHAVLARTFHDPSLGSDDQKFQRLLKVRERILDRPETLGRRAYAALWTAARRTGVLRMLKSVQRQAS
jgi:hypothetical protein